MLACAEAESPVRDFPRVVLVEAPLTSRSYRVYIEPADGFYMGLKMIIDMRSANSLH